MMTLQQAQALLATAGVPAQGVGDGSTRFTRVHSDTRTLQPGDLFVALRGERFDAHDFLPQARAAGACAVLAERGLVEAGLPGLQVADALHALQQLARAWRQSLPVALIGVAGSNGKTTVTQMIAAILRAWLGEAAFATRGNLNNQFGVPLTLLSLRADTPAHRVGVVEIGTNHPGEIAPLAALVQANVAVLTNTQREHQEYLQGLDAVAAENGALIDSLGPNAPVVLPAADAGLALWRRLAGARPVSTFALGDVAKAAATADITGRAVWQGGQWQLDLQTPQGAVQTTVTIAGRHNAGNAVAAAAAALAAGAPLAAVAQGLAAFRPVVGRSRTLPITWLGRPATLIDDAYNANPDSVLAAIDVLADLPGPRWLLLGDMGEVGADGPAFHAEVGRHAALRAIDTVWTFGRASAEAARLCGGRHFNDMNDLLTALGAADAPAAVSLLVKGSRSMRMERVVQALTGAQEDSHAA